MQANIVSLLPHLLLLVVFILQVIVFGGQEALNNSMEPIKQSQDIHILDLAVQPLRWRRAPVTNIKYNGLDSVAFPCVSVASMPEQRVIALKYFKVSALWCVVVWCVVLWVAQQNRVRLTSISCSCL